MAMMGMGSILDPIVWESQAANAPVAAPTVTMGTTAYDVVTDAKPTNAGTNDAFGGLVNRLFKAGESFAGAWLDSQVSKWASEQQVRQSGEPVNAQTARPLGSMVSSPAGLAIAAGLGLVGLALVFKAIK
jgi:hypothetical protein